MRIAQLGAGRIGKMHAKILARSSSRGRSSSPMSTRRGRRRWRLDRGAGARIEEAIDGRCARHRASSSAHPALIRAGIGATHPDLLREAAGRRPRGDQPPGRRDRGGPASRSSSDSSGASTRAIARRAGSSRAARSAALRPAVGRARSRAAARGVHPRVGWPLQRLQRPRLRRPPLARPARRSRRSRRWRRARVRDVREVQRRRSSGRDLRLSGGTRATCRARVTTRSYDIRTGALRVPGQRQRRPGTADADALGGAGGAAAGGTGVVGVPGSVRGCVS